MFLHMLVMGLRLDVVYVIGQTSIGLGNLMGDILVSAGLGILRPLLASFLFPLLPQCLT